MRGAAVTLALLVLHHATAEDAAPSSPVARIVQRERFLLYDVIFHEQVNKQRRALMFFLDLAMKLKRTLVLPRTRLIRRLQRAGSQFDPNADYVAWGELFNLSTLAALHPVMELEQFLELHGGVSLHISIDPRACTPSTGAVRLGFNGLEMHAASQTCDDRVRYEAHRMLAAPYADEEAISFSPSVDQTSPQVALPLRPWVRFEQAIYDAAAAFAHTAFGGEPFVALHWRRTDFLSARRTQEHALQSAPMLIRHARAAMRQFGLKHVYLATDSDDADEVEQVKAALQPARYTPARAPRTLRERVHHANIEIALCAMAARFLGTRTSSFTLAIIEERTATFGHAANTGTEMGAPPPLEAKDEL